MERDSRIRTVYLHHFMSYYNNKIDIDELCKRLRRLDKHFNQHSPYYNMQILELSKIGF